MIITLNSCHFKQSTERLFYMPTGEALSQLGGTNTYPIVLVHGFGGFGRDELIGYKYWGGFVDIQEELKKRGYETITAVIGPFSSNWDRACELFAYIKGGTVDYGLAHSERIGHRRFGRTYPGIYPEWGEIDPITGKINKIHLIAHSQGGQTSRTLIQLLEQGCREEVDNTPDYDTNPLFQGSKNWVHSLTTISTPHDGMTVNYMMNKVFPFAQRLVRATGMLSREFDGVLYDFKMDQWELERKEDESFFDYAKRLRSRTFWRRTEDTSDYDLSPEGASVLNKWVKAQPNVYYFSYATEETFKDPITGYQYPEFTMDLIWFPAAIFMGSFTRETPGEIVIDETWWQNDGVVNTNSMDGPTLNSTDEIIQFNGNPQKGKWNYMGVLESCDHADIIGSLRYFGEKCPEGYNSLLDWYIFLAEFLTHLPE